MFHCKEFRPFWRGPISIKPFVFTLGCLLIAGTARSLEVKDLTGFWKGSLQELDEKGDATGKLPATLDVLEKKDGSIEALFSASVYFSRLKKFELNGNALSFEWNLGDNVNT